MRYEEFLKRYPSVARDTPLGKLDIFEEKSLLKDAREIEIAYQARLFEPKFLKELLGGVRLRYEELLKKRRIASRAIPIRIISRKDSIFAEGVPYHYVYALHYSPDLIVTKRPKRTVRDILRRVLFDGNRMRSLEDSPFPNHLGVHILAFTSDGYAVLLKRSKKVTVAKKALSLIEGTVSGDLKDRTYTLYDLALEEISEELGVKEADVYAVSYFRSARLMGRPSIGLIAFLKASSKDLRPSREGKLRLIRLSERIETFDNIEGLEKLLKVAKQGSPTLKRLVLKLSQIVHDRLPESRADENRGPL